MKKHTLARGWDRLRRLLKRKPDREDPYARVRVPLKKGPGGLSASVALEEPRE